jgi:uncharacterized protein YbjQ (UPF0145 family)
MIVTTTPEVQGRPVQEYFGIVTGEAILGANVFRDLFASIRDVIGGRSGSYERVLREARDTAIAEMTDEAERRGANAVVGVDLDYETIGDTGSMLMVSASGTAVRLAPAGAARADPARGRSRPRDAAARVGWSASRQRRRRLEHDRIRWMRGGALFVSAHPGEGRGPGSRGLNHCRSSARSEQSLGPGLRRGERRGSD